MIRNISVQDVTANVAELCMEANYHLGNDVRSALQNAVEKEISSVGKGILQQLVTNADIASTEKMPICQDTGFTVIFLEIGQEVHLFGGDLYEAVDEGIRQGYMKGYLRKSIVNHPLERVNTGDNTPGVIHTKIVPGNQLKITVVPKGGGSENMSAVKMLKPSEGVNGVKKFILEQVATAGPNSCPPVIVGVGIGGTLEKVALLAKEALLRPVGEKNSIGDIAKLEEELLIDINKLGIGPQGFGGVTTALAVHIEIFPAHIASLPVAVNINCHASRHKTRFL
jgi:fumarate hydratase subunit alpha